MESISDVYVSPSFSIHSSNNLADIADRVVQELRIENGFDDDTFDFSEDEDDTPANTSGDHEVNANSEVNNNTHTEKVNENVEDEQEFEFPVVCIDSDSLTVSTDEVISDGQISPRYPLFDRSLLLDDDSNSGELVNNNSLETDSKPAPVARLSLAKLFSEDRDSPSSSSSEADDLDGITPGTYCVWKPTEPRPRGHHKKSNSISIGNTSKRWKVRDLLKRSFSDDNYTVGKDTPVFLFSPPVVPKQKTNEKVKKIEKTAKVASAAAAAGDGGAPVKTEKNIPAYRTKIGNIRIPPYLPYRQDQIAAFANFNGSNKNMYRY